FPYTTSFRSGNDGFQDHVRSLSRVACHADATSSTRFVTAGFHPGRSFPPATACRARNRATVIFLPSGRHPIRGLPSRDPLCMNTAFKATALSRALLLVLA